MFDLYAEITRRMIAELEKGRIPWQKPWTDGTELAISHATGKPYSLLNQILLGFRPGEYLTFRQCGEEGGHVRRGEKAAMIVFSKWIDKRGGTVTILPDGSEQREQIPILKYYSVFHIDQCEGIAPRFSRPVEHPASPDAQAEGLIHGYVARSGLTFLTLPGHRAFYRPKDDTVVVPEISQFTSTAEYYSTAFHELTHSTGHPSRLNRPMTGFTLNSRETYGKEELIAEMGAAFLVALTGLETPDSFRNSAAYLQGWLKALRDDKRLIVSAGGAAQKAVELILGPSGNEA